MRGTARDGQTYRNYLYGSIEASEALKNTIVKNNTMGEELFDERTEKKMTWILAVHTFSVVATVKTTRRCLYAFASFVWVYFHVTVDTGSSSDDLDSNASRRERARDSWPVTLTVTSFDVAIICARTSSSDRTRSS